MAKPTNGINTQARDIDYVQEDQKHSPLTTLHGCSSQHTPMTANGEGGAGDVHVLGGCFEGISGSGIINLANKIEKPY